MQRVARKPLLFLCLSALNGVWCRGRNSDISSMNKRRQNKCVLTTVLFIIQEKKPLEIAYLLKKKEGVQLNMLWAVLK